MTEPAAVQTRSPSREVLLVIGALMLVMLLASLDQTIVSTALPTIVGELGGLDHLSWIVTAYMLATTVVTPLYGKLGDLFGRKLVLQGAIVLFLIGSVLCGMSQSMLQLILFRALQGLGGGGLMVTSMAAVGDIISPRERGRYQGYFGAVFGVSTVVGPLLGGFFVEHLSWRWIFYINLPLGLAALAVIGLVFHAPEKHKSPRIDLAGAGLLAAALIAAILLTSLGGHTMPWGSAPSLTLAALAIASTIGFILVERRVAEPILPLSLFANRTFAVAAAVGFIVGVAMFGAVTWMPVFLQVVKGVSPSLAGMQITPMMGGVLLTSIVSGQIISRVGRYRMFPIAGTAIMAAGLGLLGTMTVHTSTWLAAGYMLVLGLGLGMVMQVLVLAVQNAVDYRNLGVATSGATLFRSIGGSFGVAAFGAVFSAGLAANLAARLPTGATLPMASDATAVAALSPAMRTVYLESFVAALQPVFLVAAAIALVAFALTWLFKEVPLREAARAEDIGESFAMPREVTSLEELETIVARISRPELRWGMIERVARRLALDLRPDEIWLLVQLARAEAPVAPDALAVDSAGSRDTIRSLAERLVQRGLAQAGPEGDVAISAGGMTVFRDTVSGFRALLAELLARWSPESHAEARAMLTEFARYLVAELPRASGDEKAGAPRPQH
jgi:EmrB/QacA subfamily drug resistance transporter